MLISWICVSGTFWAPDGGASHHSFYHLLATKKQKLEVQHHHHPTIHAMQPLGALDLIGAAPFTKALQGAPCEAGRKQRPTLYPVWGLPTLSLT